MEKRKWLWKRKSSEKSSCETESSGSISSHSERYSDEQEAIKGSPDHNTQSPEVSSKAAARTEVVDESSLKTDDLNDSVRILTERLSAALVNVSAKEDLVKQHAKVAEEAVAGWEKAENEVAVLKQQLEAVLQQKLGLEDRASHLDGALKECVRQLRQARDDQEQKIHEAVSLKTLEWESTKCILESKLLEVQKRAEFSARVDPDIYLKLEFLEKENSALRLEIHDQMEELEVRTIERDLSTQAAETASKQHLESIKKVAKLEAECRRLKAMACKSPFVNDHKSVTASSTYVESFTDSHSDSGDRLNMADISTQRVNSLDSNKRDLRHSGSWASALIAELDQFKNEKSANKSLPNSSVEINLMDDFLEMERLAALQPTESRSDSLESESKSRESVLRAELDAMINRSAELEQKLAKLETEKADLEACDLRSEASVLREELEASMRQTIELEERMKRLEEEKVELENKSGLVENALRTELNAAIRRVDELEEMLEKLEAEKVELENGSKTVESVLRSNLDVMIQRTAELEGKLEESETEKVGLKNELENRESVQRNELEVMNGRAAALEDELEKVRNERTELEGKLENFETEKAELEDKLEKLEIEKAELEANESKHGESVLRAELAVIHQKAELEEKLEKLGAEKAELETALTESREHAEASQRQLVEAELKIEALRKELSAAEESKQRLESQLVGVEAEARTVSAKMSLLEAEVQRERALCRELEEKLSIEKEEVKLRRTVSSNSENKIKQEDVAVAAGKLAECQKTIASLGNQLKSLATLEDFLIDASNLPEFSTGSQVNPRTGEQWRFHSNQTFSPKRDLAPSKIGEPSSPLHSLSKSHENPSPPSSTSSSSSTSAVVVTSNVGGLEKNRNGFAKFFSRTKSGIRLEI